MRIGAEWTAAVGDDLAFGWKLGQPALELGERDQAGSLDLSGGELLRWPHVDKHDLAARQPFAQVVAAVEDQD